ncbi:cohesin domain-containing protein [Candidatus Woesearchaeota archaeon]|nr:cohesin domain-containing protein [Candidatus Woesearchaeota archaeon]
MKRVLIVLILLFSISSVAGLVKVEPSPSQVDVCEGKDFVVDISISGVNGVSGFQFDLSYNQNVLEVIDVDEGGFLSRNNLDNVYWIPPDLSTLGIIRSVACVRQSEVDFVNGDGVLATVSFRVKDITSFPVTSQFVISNIKISDNESQPLDNSKQDGAVTVIDDSCGDCTDGETQNCGTDVGECEYGTQTCQNGVWGDCIGGVDPSPELYDGLDNNCNNLIDDCAGYSSLDCKTSNGCNGTRRCVSGYWSSTCEISGYYCDSDCDGDKECVNDPCPECDCIHGQIESCYSANTSTMGVGNCKAGIQSCSDGEWGDCIGEITPVDEVCDNKDNDCDGTVDEGCECVTGTTQSCGIDTGECKKGIQTCTNGTWDSCVGSVSPVDEICDGKDNDCDGSSDEELGSTPCGLGVCEHTVDNCILGIPQECDPLENASVEVCDGVLDEDCDGSVDEGCNCTIGDSRDCTANNTCAGEQNCINGTWDECITNLNYCDTDCNETWECVDEECFNCTECIEKMTCGEYGPCVDNVKSRNCTVKNKCTNEEYDIVSTTSCGEPPGPTPTCQESWVCSAWGGCEPEGLRRRSCLDSNTCGTTVYKPSELETCLYTGNCNDGLMNGDEQGVDCGGSCSLPCANITLDAPKLIIFANPISAEILDNYLFEVNIENIGEKEARNVEVVVNGWADGRETILSLSPGMKTKKGFLLSLPGDPYVSSVDVQLIQDGSLLLKESIPVSLSVPEYSFKLNKDPQTGKLYQVLIVDNRNKEKRKIGVEFSVSKGKETYFIDTDRKYEVGANQVYHRVDYLQLENLPAGEYEVESSFYEQGKKIKEVSSPMILEGEEKSGFSLGYLFYLIIIALVAVSGYVFYVTYKKR